MSATFSLRRALLLVVVAAGIAFIQHAYAQSAPTIVFPIPELGNCADQVACKAYCDDLANRASCVEFAEKHNLARKTTVSEQKPFSGEGPGGCTDKNSCRTYCEDASHAEECLSFAEKNGLMKKEEVERARKFVKQTGPGGCRGDACRDYCADTAHVDECVKFAEENNFISKEDAARAKKMMQAAQKGGPGGCKGSECQAYCMTTEHQKECYEFAKKEGFTRPEDDERFETGQKLKQALEQTGGPGGCKSEEACRAYCMDASHVEECIAFAASKGGVPQDRAKKMLEEFSKRQEGFPGAPGMEGMEQRMEKFNEMQKQFLQSRPPEGFEKNGFPPSAGFQEGRPDTRTGGPGGCSSAEECMKYCAEHMEECAKFANQPAPGMIQGKDPAQFEEGRKKFTEPIERNEKGSAPFDDARKRFVQPSEKREGIPQIPPRENIQGKFMNPSGCASPEECAKLMNQGLPGTMPQGGFPQAGMMQKPSEFAPQQQPGVFESAPQQPMPFPGATAPEQNMLPPQPQSGIPLKMFLGGVMGLFARILQ